MSNGVSLQKAKETVINYERMLAGQLGLDYAKYNESLLESLGRIQARGSKNPPDVEEQ